MRIGPGRGTVSETRILRVLGFTKSLKGSKDSSKTMTKVARAVWASLNMKEI